MKQGDFRERLKNYSEEPSDSDWTKMAQLLDMSEKKKRRPFFWKFIGAAMLIGVLIGGALFIKIEKAPVILPQNDNKKSVVTGFSESNIANKANNAIPLTDPNPSALNNNIDSDNELKDNDEELNGKNLIEKTESFEVKKSSNTQEFIKNNRENKSIEIIPSIPLAKANFGNNINFSISKVTKAAANPKGLINSEVVAIKAPVLNLNGLSTIKSYKLFVLNERAEEKLTLNFSEKPEVKIYETASNYFSVGIAASFPKVIAADNTSEPILAKQNFVPIQNTIPNLGIELGFGRKWDSGFSLEIGARTSYLQYRLSKVIKAKLAESSGLFVDELTLNEDVSRINRNLILSPYIRAGYDWKVFKNSFVGIFGAIGPNFVFDLPSSDLVGLSNLDLTTSNEADSFSFSDITESKNNYEAEFGITLGQKVLGTSQMTMHFSYGLTFGNLVKGTVSLNRDFQSINSDNYEVNGNGLRFKLRYYL